MEDKGLGLITSLSSDEVFTLKYYSHSEMSVPQRYFSWCNQLLKWEYPFNLDDDGFEKSVIYSLHSFEFRFYIVQMLYVLSGTTYT